MSDYLPIKSFSLPLTNETEKKKNTAFSRVRQLQSKSFFVFMLFCAMCMYLAGGSVGYAYGARLARAPAADTTDKAVMVLRPNDENVTGTLTFTQAGPDAPVRVTGTIFGLTPNAERGFHVHQYGDLTNGCTSAGAHWNPTNTLHGAPSDPLNKRHTGDLGNLKSDGQGVAKVDYTDVVGGLSLSGERSIVGRSLVVHDGVDDLGRTSAPESKLNGNSGNRAACGVIGIADPSST